MIRYLRSSMTGFAIWLALQSCATIAFGAICENLENESFGSNVASKYFLSGNYSELLDFMASHSIEIEDPKSMADKLTLIAPGGFRRCVQLIERVIDPGVKEEIVMMIGSNGERIFFGFLLFHAVEGWFPAKFNVSDDFDETFAAVIR